MKKAMITGIAIVTVSTMLMFAGCGVHDNPEEAVIAPDSQTYEFVDDTASVPTENPECIEVNEPEDIEIDEPGYITVEEVNEQAAPSTPKKASSNNISNEETYEVCSDDIDYVDEVIDEDENEVADETESLSTEDINQMVLEEIKGNMPGTWTYSNEVDNVYCEMHFAADGTVKLEAYDYDHETEDISCGTWRVAREDDNAVLVLRMPNKFYNFETRWALCDCYFDGSVDLSGLSFFYDTEINASGYFTKAY